MDRKELCEEMRIYIGHARGLIDELDSQADYFFGSPEALQHANSRKNGILNSIAGIQHFILMHMDAHVYGGDFSLRGFKVATVPTIDLSTNLMSSHASVSALKKVIEKLNATGELDIEQVSKYTISQKVIYSLLKMLSVNNTVKIEHEDVSEITDPQDAVGALSISFDPKIKQYE